jgi:hypothetical protein
MAIIYSYPNITPTSEDLLLISDISVEGNPTKTATINDVLALLPSGGGGGGISSIQSSNSNFLSVTNPTGPLVTLNLQTGFVSDGGNTLATTGDIYNFTTTSITNAIDNLGALTSFACNITNIPAFSQNVTTTSTGATTLTISRTGGSPNTFLDYTGNWSTPSVQGMTRWKLTADLGGVESIEQDEIVDIEGDSTKISTQLINPNPGEYIVTVSHDTQTQTNTTPGPTAIPNGGTFTALSQNVDVDGTGHVTGQTLRTYQLPTVGGVNTVSAISPVFLDPSGTASDPVIAVDLSSKQDVIEAVTGNGTSGVATLAVDPNTNLLTLNVPQYAGGGGGGVTSVGLNMSSNIPAFSVSNSPITTAGDLVVGITGTPGSSQYLDGSGNWSTPAGTATNLSNVPGANSILLQSSSGTNTTLPAAITTAAGVMTAADKTRLNQLIITTSSETALGPSPINTSSNTLTLPWNGLSSQVVLGDGSLQTLSTIPGTYTWTIEGDTGGPTSVASGNAIDIAGGTNITTELVGTTLTINSSAGGGTVTSIGATNSTFISGVTSTNPNPITTTGDLEYSLRAIGTPDATKFLRGDGNGVWSALVAGTGVATIVNDTNSPYDTTIGLDYTTSNNFIKSAANVTSVSPTDTVIINQASTDDVKEVEVTKLFVKGSTAAPLYFSVDKNGNIQNSGNIASDTQGFGTSIVPALNSGTGAVKISFSGRASTSTDYMVNFTVEQPLISGGTEYAVSAWIPSSTKSATDFIILYDKGATGSGQGFPELTNFIIYD